MLSEVRTAGFSSPNRIQVDQILACSWMTMEREEDLLETIFMLDRTWMKHWLEKNPR